MKKNKDTKDFSAYLGKGCNLNGEFNFDGVGRIDGYFTGKINSKDKLVVGETGFIEGDIKVSEIVIYGKIKGDIDVKKATIYKTGKVFGEFKVVNLITESGAIIEGNISMTKKDSKKIENLEDLKLKRK